MDEFALAGAALERGTREATMTDKRSITRRDSLKRIAATGALIGGSGFALGTAGVGAQNNDDFDYTLTWEESGFQGSENATLECESDERGVWNWVLTGGGSVIIDAQLTVTFEYIDADGDTITADVTVEGDDVFLPGVGRVAQFPVVFPDDSFGEIDTGEVTAVEAKAEYNLSSPPAGNQVLTISSSECFEGEVPPEPPKDKKKIDLIPICVKKPKDDKKYDGPKYGKARYCVFNRYEKDIKLVWRNVYKNQAGVLEIPAGDMRCFWADLDKKGKGAVALYHNKKKIAETEANLDVKCEIPEPAETLRLVPICYEKDRSKFRVDNLGDIKAHVEWRAYDSDEGGPLYVEPNSSRYFWVPADKGNVTVKLFYKDEQIDVKHANDQKKCEPASPKEGLKLKAKCYVGGDGKKKDHGKAKYCVTNDYKHDAKVVWRNAYKKQAGVLKVPSGGKGCFWADLDKKGKGRVTLHYNKKQIDKADANLDVVCEDDDNDNNDNGNNAG